MDNADQISEASELLKTLKDSSIDCLLSAKKLFSRLENNELPTDSGISILELKNKIFISYLIDIADTIKHKLLGESNNVTVERLVEERVVLEKIRPIEDKLKYQIDMLMKSINTGKAEDNPLSSKPDFSFVLEENETEDKDGSENGKQNEDQPGSNSLDITKQKNQLYVPPKLAQMKFEDDQEKKMRNLEHAKKRAMNSSIIKELRKEFDDAPEEEYDGLINQKRGIGKFLKKKAKFEEDNFIRLNLTKKQKAEARKLSTVNSIADDVTRFNDISVLNIENTEEFVPNKKSKKIHSSNKNRKSNKRKFRKR